MNVLSLFSGIGGLDLAAEWAGMTIVGQVEIDPFCRRVLAHHWPDVPRFEDVHHVTATTLRDAGICPDLICGGFPCQPVSAAGHRQGQADARWLWPEMARLIADTRPRWVVAENVPGLVTLGLDDVLDDLEAAGYTARTLVYQAAMVGAPHRRERVFIVAYTGESGLQERLSCPACGTCTPADDRRTDRGDALLSDAACQHGDGRGAAWRGRAKPANRRGATESGMGQPTHGLPGRLAGRWPAAPGDPQAAWEAPRTVTGGMPERAAKLKALGNAVVPQQAYPIFAAIAALPDA